MDLPGAGRDGTGQLQVLADETARQALQAAIFQVHRQERGVVQPVEPEELLEQRGGAVEHGAELRAARFLDLPFYRTGKVKKDPVGAADVRARFILELANGPTTPEADIQ